MRTAVLDILLAGGILLIAAALLRGLSRWRRRGWKSAVAEVLYSDIRPVEGRKPYYTAICILRWQAGGRPFVSQLHVAQSAEFAGARDAAAKLPVGSQQQILYSPGSANHRKIDWAQEVCLVTDDTADKRVAAVCGIVGGVCCLSAISLLKTM